MPLYASLSRTEMEVLGDTSPQMNTESAKSFHAAFERRMHVLSAELGTELDPCLLAEALDQQVKELENEARSLEEEMSKPNSSLQLNAIKIQEILSAVESRAEAASKVALMRSCAKSISSFPIPIPTDIACVKNFVSSGDSAVDTLRLNALRAVELDEAQQKQHKETREEFEADRRRLLIWCRQQKTNLDAMIEPEHVQEFCASLLNNFPTMEENFTVLQELAEPLLSYLEVQEGLIEANEVWLNLQVSAYERLRQTLLEIHPKAKLEDEVREFSVYPTRVKDFLGEFTVLLSSPSDAESLKVVKPVLESCGSLKRRFAEHENLSVQLKAFSSQMEFLREAYSNLRRAVLSRLTFLPSSIPTQTTSTRRLEEYAVKMKELQQWMEIKSQGESWRDIHKRVESIRQLIEKEQASLVESKKL